MSDQAPSTAATTPATTPPTPAVPPPGVSQGTSLQDQLRASRKRAANKRTEDFQIPGYDPPLYGTFRALEEYSDVRKFVNEHAEITDDAEKELLIGADTLAASCVGLHVKVDGVRCELDLPPQGFTPQTAAYLVTEDDGQGGERPVRVDNNRQAVLAIFPNTLVLMTTFAEIDMWFKKAGAAADEELAGDPPPS